MSSAVPMETKNRIVPVFIASASGTSCYCLVECFQKYFFKSLRIYLSTVCVHYIFYNAASTGNTFCRTILEKVGIIEIFLTKFEIFFKESSGMLV